MVARRDTVRRRVKSIVKLTFLKRAWLEDPARLFNASLDGNARRAIDIHQVAEVDAVAFKALIRAAVAPDASGEKARPRQAKQGKGVHWGGQWLPR